MNMDTAGLPSQPVLVTTKAELKEQLDSIRSAGMSLGLVPTMGALHEGHLSLVRQSVAACDRTIVTIFVNPSQFGPNEDLSRYPRTLRDDLEALANEGVDLVFSPANDEIYPEGFSTYVEPPEIALPLEGKCRPGHFRGVATIVLKLFLLVPADIAYFGQKDFQQFRVIEQMVCDLNVPIRIQVCPTVRESDGLAMSSRNRYLTTSERDRSLALSTCLESAVTLYESGERNARVILESMQAVLASRQIERIDYVSLVDPATFGMVEEVTDSTVALVAAFVGNTRLIDNRRMS